MSSEDTLTRKPVKKPSAFHSALFSAAASSRFRKRYPSEASTSSSQGLPDPDLAGSSSSEHGQRIPSHSTMGYDDSLGAEDATSVNSRHQVRLVRQGPSVEALMVETSGMGTATMDAVTEQSLTQSPEPITPGFFMQLTGHTGNTLSSSGSAIPNTTASRIHWNQLRNAILPGAPLTAPAPPLAAPADLPHSVPAIPPRSQTPKPSRLARLGFRQVVDQTREIIHPEARKFEADVYQACAIARFGEVRQKVEKDGSQGSYLSFMSASSLPLSVASSSGQQGKSGPIQLYGVNGRPVPSVKLLHQTLVRYSSLSGAGGTWLPYEMEILSVLLIPFTGFINQCRNDERVLAVETFELASKTWRASSPQREIDRILWCCKAGLIPASPVRSRILETLSNMLFSSTPLQNANPLVLQNLVQGLQLLLHSFSKEPQNSSEDIQIVFGILANIVGGAGGKLDRQEIETEYEAKWEPQDDEGNVRNLIIAEGIMRCMQFGSGDLRRWVLHESVEKYWTHSSESSSLLCGKIVARLLLAFLHASLSILNSNAADTHASGPLDSDSTTILRLLVQRALPELARLPLPNTVDDVRALAVELATELLSTKSPTLKHQVVGLICGWCEDHNGWKQSLETGLKLFVQQAEWPRLTKILQRVLHELPEDKRVMLVPVLFPALHTRMVVDPAPPLLPELTFILRSLAQLYPQQFYKPLFSLAGATKDLTVVGQLAIVTTIAQHLPEFWIHDPEMISVALMSDIGGGTGKGKAIETGSVVWGKTGLGQCLIMVELVRRVRQLTRDKKEQISLPDASQSQAYRFVTELEARLAILLDAKEKSSLVPFSQRILLCLLFLEIRRFTRSLKPAPWLQKIVAWAVQSYSGEVNDDAFDEVLRTVSKMRSIHIACWQNPPHTQQRSSTILSSIPDQRIQAGGNGHLNANLEPIGEREELMAVMSTGVSSITLRLLVAVSALFTEREHHILGPVLWSRFLDEHEPCIVAPACFLLTLCWEKYPKDITDHVEKDRCSADSITRKGMVRRLMTLFAWRSQLLAQPYIYDRAHRRPFRMARQPIAFVAIDAGSGYYVHEQTEEDRKNLPGGSLPFELRKRLAEVGWEQDDQPTDTRLERVKAPISLFSASQFERFSLTPEHASIVPLRGTGSAKLLPRRKSSTSGHSGTKRRPVFVPALASVFSSIALLTVDSNYEVASAAREAILLMLRDDPVTLCRPIMEVLSTDLTQMTRVASVLSAFLHVHHRLPPSASHHIFSHLSGFLKYVSRDFNNSKALRAFSYTIPPLAKLITQVSDLSIRDLRRAKLEIYVFPSGPFWFPSTAAPSPMFPQSLAPVINPFDDLPPQLMGVLMVRTAQNMLLLDMLKHKPQEVHAIRKSLARLALPGQDAAKDLTIGNFCPRRSPLGNAPGVDFRRASLALSRSHLLLLGQIFRSMSRNFNGRVELARLFDGLNRILLAHGDDIGIVTHALIACMIAVTRFKRLISSSGGFSLFMPSIFKVYAESEGHAGIRQAIHYASGRFYAIYQEAYVFQSLDLASNILAQLDRDHDWLAKNIYELFSALKSPFNRTTPDAAAICGSNMVEEREALIAATVSDEIPHTDTQDSPRGEQLKKILAVGQYETLFLNLDDLVRLFLTVIAHDPTVTRAQNFLVLLRYMAPEFYNGSNSARTVLRDGVNALGSALFAKASRQRAHENLPVGPVQNTSTDVLSIEPRKGANDPFTLCDQTAVRREYLKLVVTYTGLGGDLRHETLQYSLDIVKSLLKEPARLDPETEGTFLHELAAGSFSRLSINPKQANALLCDIAPVIKVFASSIDCSGVLNMITELVKRPEYENDDAFTQTVAVQIVGPILDACDEAASENKLLSLPMRSAVVSLISQATNLKSADIISCIENQRPSPAFLAGIVLPLCLTMKTSAEITTQKQWRNQDRLAKHGLAFVRLLIYAMEASNARAEGETGRSSPLPTISRRESQRSKNSSLLTTRSTMAALTFVMQIIKVIVVRAADDLSRGPIDIWARLARFFQALLDDGDARFALPSKSSSTSSTLPSSILGSQPFEVSRSSLSDHDHTSPAGAAPRVVDYLTWSLLEYLCRAPSPLTLQMRLWMQERVHNLDMELRSREQTVPFVGNGARRLSFSVFTKARGSSTSPDALHASRGLLNSPSELSLPPSTSVDSITHNHFSSRSSLQPSRTGPRIIHLGPTNDSHLFHHMDRPSQDNNLKNLARTSNIELPSLVNSTYTRIQIVQTCMGYDHLLPVVGQRDDPNTLDLKVWTKSSALRTIVAEAKELMNEFHDNLYDNIGDDFVDVPSGTGFGSTTYSL